MVGLVALGLALAGRVAVPMPGSPVPVSAQSLALVLGLLYAGPRRTAWAVALWLGLAVAGLPVLAEGRGGLAPFTGAGAGFLAGFFVACLADIVTTRRRPWMRATWAHVLILLCGGLGLLAHDKAPLWIWEHGLRPFLPGGLAKVLLASLIFALVPRGTPADKRPARSKRP